MSTSYLSAMPSSTYPHTYSNMDSTTLPQLSREELNAAALETFVYNAVTEPMIEYLAMKTSEVIACDSPKKNEPTDSDEGPMPTLKEFITRLVVCSNVQVPTLMSSLVSLPRLKARLQPHATGRRSTPHRIFLATLILAAKYLNDSSPKNKHWARYTYVPVISNDGSGVVADFSFRTAEVNEMERQLLCLLGWDLRIEEQDLYREFDVFLEPIRRDVADRFARRQRRKYEERVRLEYLQKEEAAARARARDASPSHSTSSRGSSPASSASSRTGGRSASSSISSGSSRSASPYAPSLTYSAGQSPASSLSSRATTPERDDQSYVYCGSEENQSVPSEQKRPHILGRLAAAFQSR